MYFQVFFLTSSCDLFRSQVSSVFMYTLQLNTHPNCPVQTVHMHTAQQNFITININ